MSVTLGAVSRESGAVGRRLLERCSTEEQAGSSSAREAAVARRCLREETLWWLRCGI